MSGALSKDQWVERVLGLTTARPVAPISVGTRVRIDPVSMTIPPPPVRSDIVIGQGRPRSGAPIRPSQPDGRPVAMRGANGRTLGIAIGADGRVALTAPPAPVREITFSGGGGKGAALPGAVQALQDGGVLKDVQVVTGASVGSMTAAMVAAGITAQEFAEIGNDPSVAGKIKQGKNMAEVLFGGGLDGKGLEDLVRVSLRTTLGKRIMEYVRDTAKAGGQPDPGVVAIGERLAGDKKGPTFGELRTLSKVIPAIKEVVISGSYMAEVDPATGKPEQGAKSQLAIFSADTEPDLEVALAVHASAALPPVFKPVDIALSSGITARFQDGGVLNNAPTTDSIAAERDLDPIPEKGAMTFVFEEEAANELAGGVAVPRAAKLGDWLTKADHAAAEYAKNRGLADRPEDIVVVPLKFTLAAKKPGGKGTKKDFSGFVGGTVNFDMKLDDKLELQARAATATAAHIQKRQLPQTRQFASAGQMLMCLGRPDLAVLAADGFAGAEEALAFRDAAADTVAALVARAAGGASAAALAGDPGVAAALRVLEEGAAGDADRQGFVARELNRSGTLDPLLDALRHGKGGGASGQDVLEASLAVNDAIKARAHAKTILRDVVYPKMVKEDPKGAGGTVLSQVDAILRAAASPEDVDEALGIAIEHFSNKSDRFARHGHKAFADALRGYLMKTS